MRSSNLNEVLMIQVIKISVLVRHCSWAATKRLWKLCDQLFCSIAINIRAVLALFTRPGGRTLRYRSPACCGAAGCSGASTGRWRMHKKRRVSPICNRNRLELSPFSPLFADKILLTSLPCRYRGELSPKPEDACTCSGFGAIRTC